MEKNAFCTIITANYLHYACALRDSLVNFDNSVTLYVFVCCKKEEFNYSSTGNLKNIVLFFPDELCKVSYGSSIYEKYFPVNMDFFRWSMKPVLMKYILQHSGCRKIFYVDADIHFFNSFNFLFDLLEKYSVILSPHNRSLDHKNDETNFNKNFTEGIYNGGFLGASAEAVPVLDWWALACLYNCSKSIQSGFYVDQKYLDLIPARFENILSLQHLGCNVAEWNKADCKRILADGTVKINGKYEIVFIHFAEYTIIDILNGKDLLLKPHLEKYSNNLKLYKPDEDITEALKLKIAELNKKNNRVVKKIQRGLKKLFGLL